MTSKQAAGHKTAPCAHGQSHQRSQGFLGYHAHGHGSDDARRLLIALAIILIFMVVEIIGGIISGSLALLADAVHMMTDAFALALAASAQWLAARPADRTLQFGYRRFQVLAAFVNGIALVLLLLWIVIEAFARLANPQPVSWQPMLVVAILGLLANGAAFYTLHPSGRNNINVRGAMLHVVSDLLGSFVAVIAALIIATTGWSRIDPILSCIVAALIAISAVRLLRETSHILLEGAPSDIDPAEVSAALEAVSPDIKYVHNLKLWLLTPDCPRAIVHVGVKDGAPAQPVLDGLKKVLVDRFGVSDSTIQLEYGDAHPDQNGRADRAPKKADEAVAITPQASPDQGVDAGGIGAPATRTA